MMNPTVIFLLLASSPALASSLLDLDRSGHHWRVECAGPKPKACRILELQRETVVQEKKISLKEGMDMIQSFKKHLPARDQREAKDPAWQWTVVIDGKSWSGSCSRGDSNCGSRNAVMEFEAAILQKMVKK